MEENKNKAKDLNVDWQKVIDKLLARKKFLLKGAVVSAVLAVIIALCSKREYVVTATLAPETQTSSLSSMVSSVTSMLGMNGAMGLNDEDALNLFTYPDLVISTPFLLELIETPVSDKDGKEYVSYEKYVASQDDGIIRKVFGWPGKLIQKIKGKPKELAGADTGSDKKSYYVLSRKKNNQLDALRDIIKLDIDRETGVTALTFSDEDPVVCTIMCDAVCRQLKDYVTRYRIVKAEEDFAYYDSMTVAAEANYKKVQERYADFVDKNQGNTRQRVDIEKDRLQDDVTLAEQVYANVVHQRELARAKVQERKPAFVFIEPSVAPQFPKNSKAKITILWFILGVVICCTWTVFEDTVIKAVYRGKSAIRHKSPAAE